MVSLGPFPVLLLIKSAVYWDNWCKFCFCKIIHSPSISNF